MTSPTQRAFSIRANIHTDEELNAYVEEIVAERVAALQARIAELELRCTRLQEIADTFLPVMESARPLVLNLERLRDAATEGK